MNNPRHADTLNLAEAAELLQLGKNATKALFDDGLLPGASFNQKHTVFLRADLLAFIHAEAVRQMAIKRPNADRPEPSPPTTASAPVRNIRTARKSPPDLTPYERRAASNPR